MSYSFFLFKPRRPVSDPGEIDSESTAPITPEEARALVRVAVPAIGWTEGDITSWTLDDGQAITSRIRSNFIAIGARGPNASVVAFLDRFRAIGLLVFDSQENTEDGAVRYAFSMWLFHPQHLAGFGRRTDAARRGRSAASRGGMEFVRVSRRAGHGGRR